LTESTSSLKEKAAKGSFLSFIGQAVTLGLRFFSSLILTRLLVPEIFGITLFLQSIAVALNMMIDVGINECAIRSPNFDKERFINTAWTVQVIRGFLMWLVGSLAAVPLAAMYDRSDFAWLLPIFLFQTVILGFQSTRIWNCYRTINMYPIIRMGVVVSVLQISSTMAWAMVSPSVWAIIFGNFVACGSTVFLSYFTLKGKMNRFCLDRDSLPEIFQFGKWATLGSPVSYFLDNFFFLILPYYFSFAVMGVFGLAHKLSVLPWMIANGASNQILMPLLTSARDLASGPGYKRVFQYYKIGVILPCVAVTSVLCILSHDLIKFLFDSRYYDAAWMLEPLGVLAAVKSVGWAGLGPLLKTEGKVHNMVFFNGVYAALLIIVGLVGSSMSSLAIILWGAVMVTVLMAVLAQSLFRRYDATTWRIDVSVLSVFLNMQALGAWFILLLEGFSPLTRIFLVSLLSLTVWSATFFVVAKLYGLNLSFLRTGASSFRRKLGLSSS
jgi:O-antigen/teichoic acid export membrane protein